MSILDIVDDGGIPVLDSMREPPLVSYMIMRADGTTHTRHGSFKARTDTEAFNYMREQVNRYGPGSYYATREPTSDELVHVWAN